MAQTKGHTIEKGRQPPKLPPELLESFRRIVAMQRVEGIQRVVDLHDDEKGASVADLPRDIDSQRLIVDEVEQELEKLPKEVQQKASGELMTARNALSQGQKVPPSTMANLTQIRNDQEMRKMLKGGCALCCTPVSREALGTETDHGLDRLLGLTGMGRIIAAPRDFGMSA